MVCQLWVPGIEKEVQITRAELDELIGPDVNETVKSLIEAIAAAGVEPAKLEGIYLVGGSSRIPLVADAIWREMGIRPTVQDNPKSVVAMGAAAWGSALNTGAGPGQEAPEAESVPVEAPVVEVPVETGPFRCQLLLVKGAGSEERGSVYTGLFVAEGAGATIRVRDEPANGRDTLGLAQDVLQVRSTRMPGFVDLGVEPVDALGLPGGLERRFSGVAGGGVVEMFERYVVTGSRAIVLAGPAESREVADTIELASSSLPDDKYFDLRLTLPVPDGWRISERLVLVQGKTGHQVTADRMFSQTPMSQADWYDRQVSALLAQTPGAAVVSRAPGRVLNRLEGEEVLVKSSQGRTALLTTLWLAAAEDGNAYEVTITLREKEKPLFTALAAVALLNPNVVARR
jgi:hypothetical protein